jgi:hypothetical protein
VSDATLRAAPKKHEAASAALVAIQNVKVTEEEDADVLVDAEAPSGG